MNSEQKQAIDQAEQAQTAINEIAPTPTLGDLQGWLLGAQRDALYDMNHSTGEDFRRHLDDFMQLSTAHQVVRRFVQLSRG